MLTVLSPKDSHIHTQRGIEYSVYNKPNTPDNHNSIRPNTKTYLSDVYNGSKAPANDKELKLDSDFCLFGDALCYTQRSTVKSIGSIIPSSLKSGKMFSQEFQLPPRINSSYVPTNRNKREDNKKLVELIRRVKSVIHKYKNSEQELVNENRELKEEISSLRKKLS